MSLIKIAEAQLIGFAHASKGYSIKSLAESMGLTKTEWKKLRESTIDLKPSDIQDLDDFFKIKT